MADRLWKAAERRVAKLIGTERTPLSGGNGKQTRSDTLHPDFFVEHKARKRHALLAVLRDAEAKGKLEGKLGIVTLTETGDGQVYVLLRAEAHLLHLLAVEIEKADLAREIAQKAEIACEHHVEAPTWPDVFRGGKS